jgi:hypothetical protein
VSSLESHPSVRSATTSMAPVPRTYRTRHANEELMWKRFGKHSLSNNSHDVASSKNVL